MPPHRRLARTTAAAVLSLIVAVVGGAAIVGCAGAAPRPATGAASTTPTAPGQTASDAAGGAASQAGSDAGSHVGSDAGSPAGSQVAALTAQIAAGFSTSRYAHRQVPKDTAPTGAYVTDCSGFVDFVVGAIDPTAVSQIPADPGHSVRAGNYARYLAAPPASSAWHRVARVADLAAGDLVAWSLPPGSADTGHIMIVRGPATSVADTPNAWVVPITDSTATPHGPDDSRNANPRNQIDPDTNKPSGVGTGSIVLLTDAAGHPTAYRWSPSATKVSTPPVIALGSLRGA